MPRLLAILGAVAGIAFWRRKKLGDDARRVGDEESAGDSDAPSADTPSADADSDLTDSDLTDTATQSG